MEQIYSFERPERFVVGTVGQPGERTFFLQASGAGAVVSVALEKAQVAALAEGVETLLREAGQVRPSPDPYADRAPLDAPIVEEFRVGDMTVAWTGDEVVVEASALAVDAEELPADDPSEPAASAEPAQLLRVALEPTAARAFVERAQLIVAARRRPCIWCGGPLDADGHLCPRMN